MSAETIESVDIMEQTEVINLTEAAAEKLDGIMKERASARRMPFVCLLAGVGAAGCSTG